MQSAPQPENEAERLAKLVSFGVLDTLPQKAFDDITALASSICGTPVALISLVDKDRQWFKSRVGLGATQTGREMAFCSHAILTPEELLVVEDATCDVRFHDNPLVQGTPDIRFYAGAPIVTDDGFALGTVCVIDQQARQLSAPQADALRALSRLVVTLLEHEKARQQEALREEEENRLRNQALMAMAVSGLDLMAYIDTQGVYQDVNQTYLDYWGCTREDVIGQTVRERVGEALYSTLIEDKLQQAFAGTEVFYEHTAHFTARGARHLEVSLLPVRNATGEVLGVVMRGHDIHALKQQEVQLQQTVGMLKEKTLEQERYIHMISHDLREPINSINNFTSLLVQDHTADLPIHAQRYLGFVRAGGERMRSLLDDLLHFVQLEKQVIVPASIDLNHLFTELQDDLSAALERSGGTLTCAVLPTVQGDASLLRVALQNLVTNALKFARQGVPPAVHISAMESAGFLALRVTDNGIGIPAEQFERIFDLFKRLHTRKQYAGTGLGLSICRRIAELHGGGVTVSSETGAGSCFTLTLSRKPTPPEGTPYENR